MSNLSNNTINYIQNLSYDELIELYKELNDFNRDVPTIDEFIDNPYFAGAYFNDGFNNYWRGVLKELYPNQYYSPYWLVNLRGCLSYDTEINIVGNKTMMIGDIVNEFNNGKKIYVISYNVITGCYDKDLVIDAFSTGIKKLYEIKLNDNSCIKCTSNHMFLDINKEWVSIDNGLQVGTKLLNNLNVISIQYINKYPVYDITTKFYHNFQLKNNIIAHNSIGRGKSVASATMISYEIAKLLCVNNPQEYLGLPILSTKIVFALMCLTLDEQRNAVWDYCSQIWASSDFFKEALNRSKLEKELNRKAGIQEYQTVFPNRIDVMIGSRVSHTLGQAVHSAVISEANFELGEGRTQQAFDSLMKRMNSRFANEQGEVPGKMIIDSSEEGKFGVVNRMVDSYKNNNGVFIDKGPIWAVWTNRYSMKETFKVFIGSESRAPFIFNPDDNFQNQILKEEPDMFIDCPLSTKKFFEADIESSLRDLAGVPTVSNYRLFKSLPLLTKAFRVSNIFEFDEFTLDFYDNDDTVVSKIKDIDYLYNPLFNMVPRFLHIDVGVTGDSFGFASSFISGFKDIEFQDPITMEISTISEPIVITDFCFGVKNKAGQPGVSFNKIMSFITWLSNIGYPIAMLTADSFESASFRQNMQHLGYEAELYSVDRTPEAYYSLKNSVNNGTSSFPINNVLKRELINIEIVKDGAKIDHPSKNEDGTLGSKDIADAVCLHSDTVLYLLSGKTLTIHELYESGFDNEWVLSYDIDNKILYPVKIQNVLNNGVPDKLLKINLDNGKNFIVTFDHLIMLRSGEFIKAQNLNIGDSLMPFNFNSRHFWKNDYKVVFHPETGEEKYVYHIVRDTLYKEDFSYLNESLKKPNKYVVVHHIDHNKFNDNPDNLQLIGNADHRKLHGDIFRKYNTSKEKREKTSKLALEGKVGFQLLDKIYPEKMAKIRSENGRKTITAYNKSEKHKKVAGEIGKRTIHLATKFAHTPEASSSRKRTREERGYNKKWSEWLKENNPMARDDVKKSIRFSLVQGVLKTVKENTDLYKDGNFPTFEEWVLAIKDLKKKGVISRYNNCPYQDYQEMINNDVVFRNHKIVSIEVIDNNKPVYDLVLNEIHNFGIDAGVFVHNCSSQFQARKNVSKYAHLIYANSYTNKNNSLKSKRENYIEKLIKQEM